MCGIFGIIGNDQKDFSNLIHSSSLRGRDTLGINSLNNNSIHEFKEYGDPRKIIKSKSYSNFLKNNILKSIINIGTVRLATHGTDIKENIQPINIENLSLCLNGIIINYDEIFQNVDNSKSDAFYLLNYINTKVKNGESIKNIFKYINKNVLGEFNIALFNKNENCIYFSSNTGSIYFTTDNKSFFHFASEKSFLKKFSKNLKIYKIQLSEVIKLNIINFNTEFIIKNDNNYSQNKKLNKSNKVLINNDKDFFDEQKSLKRCTKCILPETYPFIYFDNKGECNFCKSYQPQKVLGTKVLYKRIEENKNDTFLVGLSGGRDSSYALHFVKKELGLKAVAYTYDWGLVSDKSRINQSIMCAELSTEHYIRTDNIKKKRSYIKNYITSWLKKPELGMVPIFMVGDKMFYYYAKKLRDELDLKNTIFGRGQQEEQMEFKLGFCGINEPLINHTDLYEMSIKSKMNSFIYYSKNFIQNPNYLKLGFVDALKGYLSSFVDYGQNILNLYHYIRWDGDLISKLLADEYGWVNDDDYGANQWRMGDGQTIFNNYIYYKFASFSEFDNFRSNQVREGTLSRDEALKLSYIDNQPKYAVLENFFKILNLDMNDTLKQIDKAALNYQKSIKK